MSNERASEAELLARSAQLQELMEAVAKRERNTAAPGVRLIMEKESEDAAHLNLMASMAALEREMHRRADVLGQQSARALDEVMLEKMVAWEEWRERHKPVLRPRKQTDAELDFGPEWWRSDKAPELTPEKEKLVAEWVAEGKRLQEVYNVSPEELVRMVIEVFDGHSSKEVDGE
jgi:hypothetical protein